MARRTTGRKPRLDTQIRELQETIEALVAERQALRSAGAARAELEANRLELGRWLRELADAAIARHVAVSGPGEAQDERQRPLGTGPVLPNERLAA